MIGIGRQASGTDRLDLVRICLSPHASRLLWASGVQQSKVLWSRALGSLTPFKNKKEPSPRLCFYKISFLPYAPDDPSFFGMSGFRHFPDKSGQAVPQPALCALSPVLLPHASRLSPHACRLTPHAF